MTKCRWILLFLAVDALLALIFLPDWFVNPRERLLGEWKEHSWHLSAEVDSEGILIHWHGSGRRRLSYEWVDDETSPYRCVLRWGEYTFPVKLEFDGRNVALIRPDLSGELTADERAMLRRWNRARGREDEDLVLRWVRVQLKDHTGSRGD